MANTKRATIRIDADVRKALGGLKETSRSVRKTEEDTARLNQTWKKLGKQTDSLGSSMSKLGKLGMVGAVAGGAVAAVGKIRELSKESLQLQAVFGNVKFALEGAAQAADGLVDNFTLAQAQVRALELGAVSTAQEFEDLVAAGSKLGMVMNGDAAKGVEDLTVALSRQSPLILDNLGISLKLSEAHELYAKQLGKDVKALTAAEKAESFRVIALKKAREAADSKNGVTGIAIELQRAEIALVNERTALLGGEVGGLVKLETAYKNLGSVNLEYGSDVDKLNRELLKYGTTIEELGGRQEVQRKIQILNTAATEKAAAAARDAAEAQAQLALETRLSNEAAAAKRETVKIERSIELALAEGVITQKEATVARIAATASRIDEAKSALALAEAEGKATNAMRDSIAAAEHAHAVQQAHAARGGGRRGGGGKSNASKLQDEAIADAIRGQNEVLERNVSLLEAQGLASTEAQRKVLEHAVFTAELSEKASALHELRLFEIQTERKAEEEFAELQAHQLELRVQAINERKEREAEARAEAEEAAARNEKLLEERHKAELARQAKLDRARNQSIETYTGGLGRAAIAAAESSDTSGKAFLKEAAEFAESRAKILSIQSLTHFAKSIGYALAGNPIKAAMEATAGAKVGAEAAAMGGLAAGLGAAGGGSSLPGGGADFGGATPSTAGKQTGPDSAGDAPISPLEQNGQPVPAANEGGAGQSIVINIDGSFVDTGGQLSELINDASANGGMSLRGGMG